MSHSKRHRRQVGLPGAIALVVANMIGTGIFTSTGFQIAAMPSRGAILWAWLIGGCLAFLGAICYGALARQLPESGGEYFFLSRTIHPSVGYINGWLSLFVGFSAPIAAAAYAAGLYSQAWMPLDPRWTGTICIAVLAIIHGVGVREGVWFQNALVLLKIGLLTVFILWAGSRWQAQPVEPAWDFEFGTFSVSLVYIFFAYSGWNAAVYIGGEVREPERHLPKAMMVGTLIVVFFYLALNVVFLWSAPLEVLAGKEDVARVAAESMGGEALGGFVSWIILVALLTSISAMLMAGPRVYAKMADDGYLPVWMRSGRPPGWGNVIFQMLVALTLLWIPTFKDLLVYIGFSLGIGTALTVWGLVRLKLRQPDQVSIPGWPWVPALFLGMVLWVTVFSIAKQPMPSVYGLLTLGLGWVSWRIQEHRRNTSSPTGSDRR